MKKLCERVLTRDHANAQALYQLAAAQALLNETAAAQQSWAQAKAIDPNSMIATSIRELVIKLKGADSPELTILK